MSKGEAPVQLWTSSSAASATGGKAIGEWSVSGLSIDTRSLKAGDLFIPLKSTRDGHDFIPQAMDAGAGAVISEYSTQQAPALIVADSESALQDLAIAARRRSKALRIAVTGSVGKTSVKEALATMFTEFGHTHKSQKSFNNHWGVPFTLASMPKETEYGVFEMGMNHAGELSTLSNLGQPDIAVITTVTGAHLAYFETEAEIAEAKSEVMSGLVDGGTLILNADNQHSDSIAQKARSLGKTVITFGKGDCDVSIVTAQTHPSGSNTRLRINYQQYDVTLSVPGAHWIANGAACMAVAFAAGIDLRKAAMALRGVKAVPGRGDQTVLSLNSKRFTLIDESYNANPTSMQAAFASAGIMTGRKIAVLGDMGELGKDELTLHADLAGPLQDAGFSRVIVTGECMRALRGALPRKMRGEWVRDWELAFEALKDELQDGDIVLIKGSNAAQLGQLVNKLKAETA